MLRLGYLSYRQDFSTRWARESTTVPTSFRIYNALVNTGNAMAIVVHDIATIKVALQLSLIPLLLRFLKSFPLRLRLHQRRSEYRVL